MRIAVVGAGGVGGYFGGRLAEAGEEVHFIARGEHLRALRAHGLRVESVRGDFTIDPVHATDDPASLGPVDVVLLAVKSWQVEDAARQVLPILNPETAVVTLQNGVEAPQRVEAVVGSGRIVPGLVRIFSFVSGPAVIRDIGGPASITFAEPDSRPSQRTTRLREAFIRAGVTAEPPPDIETALWEKFVFVVPMGGVGAVSRTPVGVLRSAPGTRRLLLAAVSEVAGVGRARGVDLDEEVVSRTMAFVDAMPPDATSSLQRDIADRRPSELEDWNGSVVRLGEAVGAPTPVNRFIYDALVPQERRARGEIDFAD